jgi:hypothetical protein
MSIHNIPAGCDIEFLLRFVRKLLRDPSRILYNGNSIESPAAYEFTPDLSQNEIDILATIFERAAAGNNFNNLPNWATWTAAEAETNVTNAIFNGATLAQVDAQIDALPASVAGMRTGLHQMAAAIVGIRGILSAMARAIIYLRNLVVK